MSSLASPARSGRRQRSSIACRYCHAKRVKCDAAEQRPCSNCRRTGEECLLIESKRGKKRVHDSVESVPAGPRQARRRPDLVDQPAPNNNHLQAWQHGADEGTGSTPVQHQSSGNNAERPTDNAQPEMLYTEILDTHSSPGDTRNRVISVPGREVVYLGETFNLTYLLEQSQAQREPDRPLRKLHYALPTELGGQARTSTRALDEVTLEILGRQNAFDLPPDDTCRQLFDTYFEFVQPHYPILDKAAFLDQYSDLSKPPSWLLLQAVLFMAMGHCTRATIEACGFKHRADARLATFKRTKALYDADHEVDKVTTVQALFLMSFWWATPMDQKDTWHWLGNAISLALTMGMHRSTSLSEMSVKEQKLWKRIWWSLFTEDKHAAAALGRPVHVRLSVCDVEPLEVNDFQIASSEESGPASLSDQERVHALYVVYLSRLSKIVERIVEKSVKMPGLSALQRNESLESCERSLLEWEAQLPGELRLDNAGTDHGIWPSMLHIAVHWFKVLARRSRTHEDTSALSRTISRQASIDSASKIVQIVENILTTGRIMHCPIHIVPSLFAAMSIHATSIRSDDNMTQELALLKLRMCMIALREVQTSWPVGRWVLLLFTKIIRGMRSSVTTDMPPIATEPATSSSAHERGNPEFAAHTEQRAQNVSSRPISGNECPVPSTLSSTVDGTNHRVMRSKTPDFPWDLSADWSGVPWDDIWEVPSLGFDHNDPMNDLSILPSSTLFLG